MQKAPEGIKTPARHALDYALKAAVWSRDDSGNYETIVPTNTPFLNNLEALAATTNMPDSPLLKYQRINKASAIWVKVKKDFATPYNPITLEVAASPETSAPKKIAGALTCLLNSNWDRETAPGNAPLFSTSLTEGSFTEKLREYLTYRLGPLERLTESNNAVVFNPNGDQKNTVFFNFSEALAQQLFGDGLQQLLDWHRANAPHLPAKRAEKPTRITVSMTPYLERPGSAIDAPEPEGKGLKGRKNNDPRQIDLDF